MSFKSITLVSTLFSLQMLSSPFRCHFLGNSFIKFTSLFSRWEKYQLVGSGFCRFVSNFRQKLFCYGKIQTVLPSAPRTLTQAQIYTINEIMKNREENTSYRGKAPTSSDTFALIPIKRGGLNIGDMYVDFSGSIQDNKRIYFGPVDIDRMHIRLLDDRGYTVNLHGQDWCITLISENLYQY